MEGLDDVAGVLGLEWFVRMPMRLDFARSRLTLYDPAKFKYAGGGTRVPVATRGRLPLVRGSIDGIEGMFEIDTGSRGSLTLDARVREQERPGAAPRREERCDHRRRHRRAAARGAGARQDAEARRRRRAQSHRRHAAGRGRRDRQVRGRRATSASALLRQFAVTYDLPNDALYFERYINFGTPDIADRGGLWLERASDGYKVVDVVADGPAAAAGLKAGDVIVEFNGYPVGADAAAGGARVAALVAGRARAHEDRRRARRSCWCCAKSCNAC